MMRGEWTEGSLIARAGSYDSYVSGFVGQLPAELVEDKEVEVPAYAQKFVKNTKGAAPEQSRKEASKRGKRRKYDLDANEDVAEVIVPTPESSTTTLAELREKLHAKLDASKSIRPQLSDEAKAAKRAKKKHAIKRPRESSASKKTTEAPPEKTEAPEDELGDVRVATVRPPSKRSSKPGAPGSKTKKLKALVAQAEERQATLASLKATGHDKEATTIEWHEALKLATGEQRAPLHAPTLQKAIKLRDKKKLKSQQAWNKRIKHQQSSSSSGPRTDRGVKKDRGKK